jgi:acyl-[acyl-carrier-protein]-phospholipid O-acyltransferase/long-chain-fatty-acid--[acyl-carrier-protein] ligase
LVTVLKHLFAFLLRWLYRVEIRGLENYAAAGPRALVVANHTSFLDAALLAVFLPDRLTFAVNTHIARAWWIKPFLGLVEFFPVDPANPYSIKSLIQYLRQDRRVVIFPEGRITVTGALMKIYEGPGLVADQSGAMVLPVRIDGAQYTPLSRLKGRVRIRWFPRVALTILPPRRLEVPETVKGRMRRKKAGAELSDIMAGMMFSTSSWRRTIPEAVFDAVGIHGGRHVIAEDVERKPLSYRALLTRSFALARAIPAPERPGEITGVLLPNMVSTFAVLLGLHLGGRVPAMLNYTMGVANLVSACRTARIRTVLTSRRFLAAAKLETVVEKLSEEVEIVCLEDVREKLGAGAKIAAAVSAALAVRTPGLVLPRVAAAARPDDPAVILFTSGSEGTPKGVVLSHANILANCYQLAARVPFSSQDIMLNALPLFHSFGLTAGAILPLVSGIRVFLYPSPLHYRIVPEVAYDTNATILFGTNTFLAGYARFAHPYDFYSVRYVFAGAEKLHEETRRVWAEKFGIRVFEGYGATETSPVLSTNTPVDFRAGSVGRLLPGIEAVLEPVPGIDAGGKLMVRGPNVMLGYLLAESPGELKPPRAERADEAVAEGETGAGWYDTGDIVTIDEDGFIRIQGRQKRFAKIAGEMVSLVVVEELAGRAWPRGRHAAVAMPDVQKGEHLVLATTWKGAGRAELLARARQDGVAELAVPKKIVVVRDLPLLGTGKIDLVSVKRLVEEARAGSTLEGAVP